MIYKSIIVKPTSINIDFEKANFNAIKLEWPNCRINRCFFVYTLGLITLINEDQLNQVNNAHFKI